MSDELSHSSPSTLPVVTGYTTRVSGQLAERNNNFVDHHLFHLGFLSSYRPEPSQAIWRTIWRIFNERVDPIVKILHSPSVEAMVTKSNLQLNVITASQKVLVSAIYFASLASMSEQEAQFSFGMERQMALEVYRVSTEQDLARTALLDVNEDFVALQALILFLTVSRMLGDVEVAWRLTGLAKRSAILHKTDLSPFQSELQKRMAWNLWYLDHRAAKDHGQDDGKPGIPSIDKPTNINDSEFNPESAIIPEPSPCWTEQTFSLVRFDIGLARSRLTRAMSLNKKREMIEECQQHITSKYIRHCTDDHDPVQWLTQHVSYVLIMEMWFELYSADTIPISLEPGIAVYHDQSTQDELFLQAIDIVDTSTRLHMEPLSHRWRWLLKGYQQFRPLSFLINELLYRKSCPAVSHAWKVVEKALDQQPSQIRDSVNGKALDMLREKAKDIQDRIVN